MYYFMWMIVCLVHTAFVRYSNPLCKGIGYSIQRNCKTLSAVPLPLNPTHFDDN